MVTSGPRMLLRPARFHHGRLIPLDDYAPEITVQGRAVDRWDGEARKAAREQSTNGADWRKVYMTHRSWLDERGDLSRSPR